MRHVSIRPEPCHRSRRYLNLALESVKTLPSRRRSAVRFASTDGPFAETKEKVFGGP